MTDSNVCDDCGNQANTRYSVWPQGVGEDCLLVCFECKSKKIYSAGSAVEQQQTQNAIMALCVHPNASNFTSQLMRVIKKADTFNFKRLSTAFPRECAAYVDWCSMSDELFKETYGMEKYR